MNIPPTPFDHTQIREELKLIRQKARAQKTPGNLKLAFSCIDLTTLNPTDTITRATGFTQKVNEFAKAYPEVPNVAAICIYPNLVSTARETLAAPDVKIASVAGGFPSSMTFAELKTEEARLAVANGAEEIDIVLPLWAFLDGNLHYCFDEIAAVKKAIGKAHLKVILESGVLGDTEKIWQASFLSLEAGADFIKTSTGKLPQAATPEAAYTMCRAIKWWYNKTGEKRGFKPAGGISTPDEALLYISIVKEVLGNEWLNNRLFRIGASRLANNLLSGIYKKEITHF
ncbi:Deoxyribose-phosphate aldolase [hydrothermal vent metagenome]|uniref:deoxyribose-phosphate aldolase n=1 Tax=hydrothermal vent metagenome TaxID=652676 RepID=A0A3B0TNK3_9ZZZZ